MIQIKNRNNAFTILYLPERHIRILPKETVSITENEFKSKEFLARDNDFQVIEEEQEDFAIEEEESIITEEEETEEDTIPLIAYEYETEEEDESDYEEEGNLNDL